MPFEKRIKAEYADLHGLKVVKDTAHVTGSDYVTNKYIFLS